MNDDLFLQQLKDAEQVVVTPHALERGFDKIELEQAARQLDGVLYIVTDEKTYHLVTEDIILVLCVRDGMRVVLTAYPKDDLQRYHDSDRFRLLRG